MPGPFMIAGLGNPGPKYAETRHNAGFWFLDRLKQLHAASFREQSRMHAETARIAIAGRDCILVRPTTFMNDSGKALRAVLAYFRIPEAELLVAYDELDLPPGTARLKLGGGHGGHNGLRDIFCHIPERGFLRLRIGIGHPGFKDQVTDYVLSRPGAEDERMIREAIDRATEVLPEVVAGDLPRAMKMLHTAG